MITKGRCAKEPKTSRAKDIIVSFSTQEQGEKAKKCDDFKFEGQEIKVFLLAEALKKRLPTQANHTKTYHRKLQISMDNYNQNFSPTSRDNICNN